MAKVPRVTLMVRRKVNGRWMHVQPEMFENGRVKTLSGDGSFSPRYKLKGEDKWEPVSGGSDAAMAPKNRREISLQAAAAGILIPADPVANRRTIDAALEEYTAEILAHIITFSSFDRNPRSGQIPDSTVRCRTRRNWPPRRSNHPRLCDKGRSKPSSSRSES